MKRHLPHGRITSERLAALRWKLLAEIARYPRLSRSKKQAKKRIHKLERAQAQKDIRQW